VQLIVSNPDFSFANLRATMLQGTSMQIYANLVLPTFAHLVARWCQRRRLSAVATTLCIGLCYPVCCIGFLPMNVMKIPPCALLGYEALASAFAQGLLPFYTFLMWNSPVSETVVWATLICAYIGVVAHAVSSTPHASPTKLKANKKAAALASEPEEVLSRNESAVVGVGMVIFQLEWLCFLVWYDISAPEQVHALCTDAPMRMRAAAGLEGGGGTC
jgi:hypothetical protein